MTDSQKKIELLKSKKVCIRCLLSFNMGHKCPEFNKRFICYEHKTNNSICKCHTKKTGSPATGIEDSDLLVEQSTVNNVAKINGNLLGAVGFDTEVLQFITKDGNIRNVLATYDSYCSHSMMDAELATDLGLELESLGVVTTHSFMGNSKQKAYKSKASIKTGPSHYIELDLLVGRCHQVLPRMQYTIPEEWAQKYKLKQSSLSAGGPNQIMIGKGACHLFPTVLECASGLQLSRSNISGKLIVSGRAEAQPGAVC